jgi:hypothetical protein
VGAQAQQLERLVHLGVQPILVADRESSWEACQIPEYSFPQGTHASDEETRTDPFTAHQFLQAFQILLLHGRPLS